ncbi:UNVERIFIED_CONTAM: hypothetical protein FKN15_043583 [Acipenser sinensis]
MWRQYRKNPIIKYKTERKWFKVKNIPGFSRQLGYLQRRRRLIVTKTPREIVYFKWLKGPQRALCVRGPLANNGKRNHREYQLSGKTSSRAVALAARGQVGPERRQPSQTPVLAPQPPPPTLHQPPPPETSRTPSIASPRS